MSVGRERPRTPQGRAPGSGEEETSDVEVPTDQGPDQSPIVADITSPAFSAPQVTDAIDEPEMPKRESTGNKNDPRIVAPDPNAGEHIGDYELLQKLGKGGAGSVFRARRKTDGRIVALKVLASSKARRARIVQRFFDEVRAASAVEHHGLIKILDFIEEEEPRRLAYAMEFVDGESLRERLKREGALDLRDAIHIGADVCDALAALHDAGIIHRDLKPENIMVLKGAPGSIPRVKLLDFGVVKFLPLDKSGAQSSGNEERPGTFVGTPRYMAPEQAAGGVIDARADLFAVGVLLFEMITGSCPHEGDSLRDVVLAKLKGAPRITINPGKEILPQELTEVVDACLQLKPGLRPKDARVVATALRDATVVLFAVGPVKADESGQPFRPASQVHASGPTPRIDPGSANSPAGAASAHGAHGSHGAHPASGSYAAQGSHGAHPASGAHGSHGAHAALGAQGAHGAHAAPGAHGSPAASGTHGSHGVSGAHGAHGASGAHGAHGASSAHGAHGASGAHGSHGASGALTSSGSHGAHAASGAHHPSQTTYPPSSTAAKPPAKMIAMLLGALAALLLLAVLAVRAFDDEQVVLIPPDAPSDSAKQQPAPSLDAPHVVLIESTPRGATVRVGGEQVGWTPRRVEVPKGKPSLEIVLSAPRHFDRTITLSRSTPKQLDVSLEPDPDAPATTATKAAP